VPLVNVEATQQGIAKALKRWASLRAKKARIEAERDRKIAPKKARFEQSCAPIFAAANAELAPIEEQLNEVEAAITRAFIAGVDERGSIRFSRVDTACAVAEAVPHTVRELDAKVFFDAVPPHERTSVFWSCLKTLVGNAERFLGAKRLNELAHARRTYRVSIHEL